MAVRGIAALTLAVGLTAAVAGAAQAETRSLKLYFVHTGERATITFKRNGKFDADGLAKLNRFLRDWRRNEPTKMDPRLFDLIWSVYQKSGSSDYINVLCGYRAPGTNEMLRNRSRQTGVAKESQHILGKAMDFYIPGVPLERLREIGLKLQMGGVGYYPSSGSPFVHMDVGGVRAWPRASRDTLVRLFPDGKTIHIPPDGKPLPGYEAAMADYKRRLGSNNIEIASSGGGRKNLFQMLFGGGDEDESPRPLRKLRPPRLSSPSLLLRSLLRPYRSRLQSPLRSPSRLSSRTSRARLCPMRRFRMSGHRLPGRGPIWKRRSCRRREARQAPQWRPCSSRQMPAMAISQISATTRSPSRNCWATASSRARLTLQPCRCRACGLTTRLLLQRPMRVHSRRRCR